MERGWQGAYAYFSVFYLKSNPGGSICFDTLLGLNLEKLSGQIGAVFQFVLCLLIPSE